jgi:hypothetical protein
MRPAMFALSLAAVLLQGCGGSEIPVETAPARGSDGVLTATVRIGGSASSMFVADEVVASIGRSERGRELVVYARSYDIGETLAFVVDLNTASFPGTVDLASHGVLYLEPGVGVGGGDLLFDGLPQGTLELEAVPTAGAGISGRFAVTLPGYDPARPSDEISATLEGTFVLQVVKPYA